MVVRRRAFILVLFAVLFATTPGSAAPLPVPLQAELLVKVAGYDKGLRARAGDTVRVLIVARDTAEDTQWARKLEATLPDSPAIGGLPHAETVASFTSAAELVKTIRAEHATIVVLPPSLGDDVEPVRVALEGVNVLSLAPDADLVKRGVVLGFELVSGKPRLFFNQSQSTRQGVSMSADILKLMTVYP